MFRLHRNRQAKSGEKFDFKLSNFKALQVPKGWDKLFVSVVSEQTGKTIIRSSKSSVRNGSCQWTEILSESVFVSQDEISKDFEECNFKLVVAMGSTRSNVLGEAVVNMANYTDSKSSSAVSLPLKKCDYDTILQVKIQCLTPLTKVRSGDLKQTNSRKEDLKKNGHDSDSCSDRTDSLSRSIGSSSGADLYSSLHSGGASSKEASFSASYSQLSNASSEVYESLENEAAKNNYGDIQRQDSASSQNSAPCSSPNSVITGSAEATTVAELRAEARMWERNAHKLMAELDQLKKEFSDQSQNQKSLNTALSTATAECDDLRKELEQLKLLTEKSTERQPTIEDLSYQDGEPRSLNELQDELKFQKEANADLSMQLKRSQESNIELVAVLQELEETTEKQMSEIEELLAQHRNNNDIENIVQENKNLMLQLEHVKESEKNLQLKVELLERNLEEKKLDLQKCKVSNQRFPQDTEMEYDMGSLHSVDINLVKEIEMLKEKVQELEKDCNELTEENMELLYKLKQANNDSEGGVEAFNSMGGEHSSNSFVNFGFDTIKNKRSTQNLEEKFEESPNGIENNDSTFNKKLESMKFELEVKVEELSRELTEKKMEIGKLESIILSKDDEIKICKILESKCSELEFEKQELELHISQMEQERMQLSERISALESQLKHVTDEKEKIHLDLEKSTSHAVGLRGEVQMLNDVQNQCAEAQDQCEYLLREKSKLEAAAEHLVEERNLLQKSNGELKKKNSELNESYFLLESKLKESLQQEMLITDDYEKLLKQLENYSSLEVKLKNSVNDLEFKLSVSEKERKQHEEELTNLKAQLQKMTLQDEDFSLRNDLEATKKEKENVEASFHLISKECEDLRTENNSLLEKTMVLLKTVAELENSKHSIPALEEKLPDMESELSQMKIVNSKYQQKLKILEEEKDECLKRTQSLEAELKLLKEEKQNQRESNSVKVHGFSKTNGKNMPSKDTKLLKNHSGKKKPASKSSQSHEQVKDPKDPDSNEFQSQTKDDSGYDEASHVPEAESVSRIQLLEKELAEALEANKKYKDQLSRLVSDNQNSKESSPITTVEGDVVEISALEEELNDIRERYLHISLKYAEVEHEREELVMKLKEVAPKNGRWWF